MKRIVAITGIILFSCLGISKYMPTAYSQNLNNQTTTQVTQSGYIVGDYNGCIAVFQGDSKQNPILKTDVPINGLPKTDQRTLKQGIEIKDDQELHKVLEDYCS